MGFFIGFSGQVQAFSDKALGQAVRANWSQMNDYQRTAQFERLNPDGQTVLTEAGLVNPQKYYPPIPPTPSNSFDYPTNPQNNDPVEAGAIKIIPHGTSFREIDGIIYEAIERNFEDVQRNIDYILEKYRGDITEGTVLSMIRAPRVELEAIATDQVLQQVEIKKLDYTEAVIEQRVQALTSGRVRESVRRGLLSWSNNPQEMSVDMLIKKLIDAEIKNQLPESDLKKRINDELTKLSRKDSIGQLISTVFTNTESSQSILRKNIVSAVERKLQTGRPSSRNYIDLILEFLEAPFKQQVKAEIYRQIQALQETAPNPEAYQKVANELIERFMYKDGITFSMASNIKSRVEKYYKDRLIPSREEADKFFNDMGNDRVAGINRITNETLERTENRFARGVVRSYIERELNNRVKQEVYKYLGSSTIHENPPIDISKIIPNLVERYFPEVQNEIRDLIKEKRGDITFEQIMKDKSVKSMMIQMEDIARKELYTEMEANDMKPYDGGMIHSQFLTQSSEFTRTELAKYNGMLNINFDNMMGELIRQHAFIIRSIIKNNIALLQEDLKETPALISVLMKSVPNLSETTNSILVKLDNPNRAERAKQWLLKYYIEIINQELKYIKSQNPPKLIFDIRSFEPVMEMAVEPYDKTVDGIIQRSIRDLQTKEQTIKPMTIADQGNSDDYKLRFEDVMKEIVTNLTTGKTYNPVDPKEAKDWINKWITHKVKMAIKAEFERLVDIRVKSFMEHESSLANATKSVIKEKIESYKPVPILSSPEEVDAIFRQLGNHIQLVVSAIDGEVINIVLPLDINTKTYIKNEFETAMITEIEAYLEGSPGTSIGPITSNTRSFESIIKAAVGPYEKEIDRIIQQSIRVLQARDQGIQVKMVLSQGNSEGTSRTFKSITEGIVTSLTREKTSKGVFNPVRVSDWVNSIVMDKIIEAVDSQFKEEVRIYVKSYMHNASGLIKQKVENYNPVGRLTSQKDIEAIVDQMQNYIREVLPNIDKNIAKTVEPWKLNTKEYIRKTLEEAIRNEVSKYREQKTSALPPVKVGKRKAWSVWSPAVDSDRLNPVDS